MNRFSRFILDKTYHANPITIAFIDGSVISMAINVLTGIKGYEWYVMLIALASSIVLIIDSILVLVWQNAASKLQDGYNSWVEYIRVQNQNSNAGDKQKSTDWIPFIVECNDKRKEACDVAEQSDRDSKEPKLPKFSTKTLIAYPILSCLFFLLGVGLMIVTFVL